MGSFAQGWRIGARARYQTDREPDFPKRLLCAHRAEGICCSKDYLEIGASRFQADKKLGYIGTEQIAAAFHHQGFGRQREAVIERIKEDVGDPFTIRRIGSREAEIDAIKSLRGSEILVSRDLLE